VDNGLAVCFALPAAHKKPRQKHLAFTIEG